MNEKNKAITSGIYDAIIEDLHDHTSFSFTSNTLIDTGSVIYHAIKDGVVKGIKEVFSENKEYFKEIISYSQINVKEEKMPENNAEQKELPAWDEIRTEQLPAVELFDEKQHILTFLVSKPYETVGHKFKGKKTFLFDVEENKVKKTLIVTSVRFAVKLKLLDPLKGKTIQIQREGLGTDIDYAVKDINVAETEEVEAE